MPTTFNKIEELSRTLKALLPMNREWQTKVDKKFRLEFNYNSNHLEGNTLTYGETELLLIFGKTTGNHDLREYEEMEAHNVALQLIKDWSEDKEVPLNETRIKNLNETILVKPYWKEAITSYGKQTRRLIKVGDYKEFPNSVQLTNGEIFDYASVADTPIMMGELMDWYRSEEEKKELHPVELAALLHYRFVRIHPFDDGNGRTARLLMNYVLLKNNLPLVIIKSADKRNYITALNQADTGNLSAFIEYIVEQLVWSLQLSIKAAKGESIDEPEDIDKEIALLKTELKGENVLNATATPDSICDAMEQNIIPLFMMIEEKIKSLKEFFFKVKREITYESKGEGGTRMVGTINSKWDSIKQNWLTKRIRGEAKKLEHIKYIYTLEGFKKSIAANSLSLIIDVSFYEYNYTIQFDDNKNQPKLIPYGVMVDIEELRSFIMPAIKDILEKIKELNQKSKVK
jgi:Fic family protein